MRPNEPYWRTNTSFSPPPPRWDFRFHSDGPSFGSQEGSQLYASSTSSNSRESRSWLRGNYLPNHQHSASDGVVPYFSSPSDFSPAQQWTPPTTQEINVDHYGTSSRRVLEPLFLSPAMEGTSAPQDSSRGSTSSRSDSSDYEVMPKTLSSNRNVSSRRSFMSKPVHPLSFPSERDLISEFNGSNHQRERHRFSTTGADVDCSDVYEPIDSDCPNRSFNPSDGSKCGLCERFLSQRSPWSSRRIVRSGDMPVAGVLSCRHVFHAECLDHITPKMRKNDPPCPICSRSEEENSPDQRVFSKLRKSVPRIRPFQEDGPSKPWTCTQAGDCVEGALNSPSRNAMILLNRNRIKKNISLKGIIIGKEFPGKMKKSGSYSSQLRIGSVDQGALGTSSKTTAGSSTK